MTPVECANWRRGRAAESAGCRVLAHKQMLQDALKKSVTASQQRCRRRLLVPGLKGLATAGQPVAGRPARRCVTDRDSSGDALVQRSAAGNAPAVWLQAHPCPPVHQVRVNGNTDAPAGNLWASRRSARKKKPRTFAGKPGPASTACEPAAQFKNDV